MGTNTVLETELAGQRRTIHSEILPYIRMVPSFDLSHLTAGRIDPARSCNEDVVLGTGVKKLYACIRIFATKLFAANIETQICDKAWSSCNQLQWRVMTSSIANTQPVCYRNMVST